MSGTGKLWCHCTVTAPPGWPSGLCQPALTTTHTLDDDDDDDVTDGDDGCDDVTEL